MRCSCCTEVLADMNLVVKRVCLTDEEFCHYGSSHMDALVDTYAHAMGIISNLWLELCNRVHSKFGQGE
jgi:hypothetical protein